MNLVVFMLSSLFDKFIIHRLGRRHHRNYPRLRLLQMEKRRKFGGVRAPHILAPACQGPRMRGYDESMPKVHSD